MKICDKCMSKLVIDGKARPHFSLCGNRTQWTKCICGSCGAEAECVEWSDLDYETKLAAGIDAAIARHQTRYPAAWYHIDNGGQS